MDGAYMLGIRVQDACLTLDALLDGVHICRIHGAHELVAACVALSSQIPPTVCLPACRFLRLDGRP